MIEYKHITGIELNLVDISSKNDWPCRQCSSRFKRTPEHVFYCSTECAKANRRSKRLERNKIHYFKNRARYQLHNRQSHLRTKFGITEEVYNELLKAQGGVCAICGGISKGRRLDVDHDHKTGFVRGPLCRSCNISIGHFADNHQTLYKAYQYLVKAIANQTWSKEKAA